MKIFQSVLYSFHKKTIDFYYDVLNKIGFSDSKIDEALLEWLSNQSFSIIGLYSKAPRYLGGVKMYQEHYSAYSPTGEYKTLAVREDFIDVIKNRTLSIPIIIIDDINNSLIIGGDFEGDIDVNDTHIILDSSNNYTMLNMLTVTSRVFDINDDITIVTYNETDMSGFSANDIMYFTKGERLVGLDAKIQWLDIFGVVLKEKTYKERFDVAEASEYEYNRRLNTINQMIASSDGTAIQPFVKSIYEHYKNPYIDNYLSIGDFQSWKNAIDNEIDARINGYLNITIPFTDIEGVTTMKLIRDWIKDELYISY
jgi:hypothetical protein